VIPTAYTLLVGDRRKIEEETLPPALEHATAAGK
jgi:hypothetical protein